MNRKNSNRTVWTLTLSLCLGLIFTQPTGYAAAEERSSTGAVVSAPAFMARLQSNDKQLTSIETLMARMDAAKSSADKDKYADNLNDTLAAYSKAMLESFDTATKQAELANNSQGREGNIALLRQFEGLAVRHERKLKQVDARAQRMMKASPGTTSTSDPDEGDEVAGVWSILNKIGDFFVTPAQAAIALSGYNACSQKPPNQVACAAAIAKGIIDGNTARVQFNTCWNNQANVKPAWWRALKRTACTVALVARLA